MNTLELLTIWISSKKKHKISFAYNEIYQQLLEVYEIMSSFLELDAHISEKEWNDKLSDSRKWIYDNKFSILSFTIAKICHSFIHAEDVEIKDENTKAKNYLLGSNIISGGIKPQFLDCFSENAKKIIHIMAKIDNDKVLLSSSKSSLQNEEYMRSLDLIYEGRNKAVDQFINLLQWKVTRKNPIAKAGGEEGMRLAR